MSVGAAAAPPAGAPTPTEPEEKPTAAGAEAPEKPPAEKGAEAPPKPRTVDDDLEDVLKRAGGLKYKAAGKEKSIGTAADLRRLLSRVDGTDSAAAEALKAKQEADGVRSKLQALKGMRPLERAKAIAELVGDEKVAREAYEELFLAEDEKAKKSATLTAKERQLQAELEARDAELAKFRTESEKAEQQRKTQEYAARVQEVGQRLEKVTVAALQKAKLAGEHAPHFLQAIAERLDRNERLGLGLDESEVADVVLAEHEALATTFVKGRAPPDLADMLEATGQAKGLMDEFARRIRAKVNGSSPAPVTRQATAPQNGASESLAEKIARARTFGGGAR